LSDKSKYVLSCGIILLIRIGIEKRRERPFAFTLESCCLDLIQ
jgi:hypothetical protein